MKQKGNMVLISLVVLIALFSVLIIFMISSFESFQKNKTVKYKGTNEDIIQYVKDTHDVDVDIVDNRGRKSLNDMGGATVRTTDERELDFNIEISTFNNIKSDTYKEESGVYSMNKALQSSGDIEELAGIRADFVDIQLPDTLTPLSNYDPFFYFYLTEEIRLSSKETIQVVNEVFPIAEKWRETAKNKYKLDMEDIHFVAYDDEENRQTVKTNIENAPKDSLEELEQHLLEKNKDAFTQHLVTEELQKIAYLEDQFDTLQFSKSDNKKPLKCNQIQN